MSAQYDNIGTLYDEMKQLPVAVLERGNVRTAIAPYIKGAKVLDLACGTGYYTKAFIEWGASHVVGVDISKTMINAARETLMGNDQVSFHVADCSVPARYEEGPFDIVFGSWFLNYASNGEQMAEMYRNIALNLKDGGHFFSVTPHPTESPKTSVEQAHAVQPPQYESIKVNVRKEIDDGVATHLVAVTKAGKVEFDGYLLRKSVYEESARRGGMMGNLNWRPMTIPEERKDRPQDEHDSSWDDYLKFPHFGVLVITKQ